MDQPTRQQAVAQLADHEVRISSLEARAGVVERISLNPPVVNPPDFDLGSTWTDRFPVSILPDAPADVLDPGTLVAYIPVEVTLDSGAKLREIVQVVGGIKFQREERAHYYLAHRQRLPKGAVGAWDGKNPSFYAIADDGRILGKREPLGIEHEWNAEVTERYRFGRPIPYNPARDFVQRIDGRTLSELREGASSAEDMTAVGWLQVRPEAYDRPVKIVTVIAVGGEPYLAFNGTDPSFWFKLEADGRQTIRGIESLSVRFVMQTEYPAGVFPLA